MPTECPSSSVRYVETKNRRIADQEVAKNAPTTKPTKHVLIQSDLPGAQTTRPCTASVPEPSTRNTPGRTALRHRLAVGGDPLLDVLIRGVDQCAERRIVRLATGDELHVAHALAVACEQTRRILERRALEEAHVHVAL